jgi:hypothetical protein
LLKSKTEIAEILAKSLLGGFEEIHAKYRSK